MVPVLLPLLILLLLMLATAVLLHLLPVQGVDAAAADKSPPRSCRHCYVFVQHHVVDVGVSLPLLLTEAGRDCS